LESLVKDPNAGIGRVLGKEEIQRLGGCPEAEFLVEAKAGFTNGSQFSGPLITDSALRGIHGYLPDRPAMESAFFLAGLGIAAGRSVGEIDMRDIAPTVAGLLGIRLALAEGHAVAVGQKAPR
jgi:hypothetical protein